MLKAALALIAVGSVGTEMDRIDRYSDLDFFVIVAPGHKEEFIEDLTWLEAAHPISFAFQNTRDGHKVLFEDGIYAEFAVFTPEETPGIPAHGTRVVWEAPGVRGADFKFREPYPLDQRSVEWLTGEIMTNLYVGLLRLGRGEALSAERLIQGNAVDTLLDLWSILEPSSASTEDPFDRARRIEKRHPGAGQLLPGFIQGYGKTAESALAILDFLDRRFPLNLNQALKGRILDAAHEATPNSPVMQGNPTE